MKILFVNACVREASRTRKLAEYLLTKLNGDMEMVDLARTAVFPLDGARLALRDDVLRTGNMEADILKYARQFAQADLIVMAAPYWDLGFPAILKNYLENITVAGVTFRYENGVPRGLCQGKKLVYITTSGGPVFADFGFPYVKALAEGLYGIRETTCFRAEGLDMDDVCVEERLENVRRQMDAYLGNGI